MACSVSVRHGTCIQEWYRVKALDYEYMESFRKSSKKNDSHSQDFNEKQAYFLENDKHFLLKCPMSINEKCCKGSVETEILIVIYSYVIILMIVLGTWEEFERLW